MSTTRSPKRRQRRGGGAAGEARALLKLQPQLWKRYRGKFVAVFQGSVVGHSDDDEELACRMYEKFGDSPFYIAKVQPMPTSFELPSPEMVG